MLLKSIFSFKESNIGKIAFITILLSISICCSEKKTTIQFSSSIDSLKHIINLDIYKPVNVMWIIKYLGTDNSSRVPGPKDYVLEAYIQYDRKTADKIKYEYSLKPTLYREISVKEYWFDWLPKDMLIKDLKDSSQVFEPRAFIKSPLLNGDYIFITVNTILIKLYTM